MKAIILEGASTSGKTTVANMLVKILTEKGKKVCFVDEEKTLMPILKFPDFATHFNHLSELLSKLKFDEYDFIIFDRLQLTSAAVTNESIKSFKEVEDKLQKYDPIMIFLQISEDKLGDRIFQAMEHREASWKEHVLSKGNNKEIADWYVQTQRNLLKGLKDSTIPHCIIDATESDYEHIAQEILAYANV